jgi:hypothetical protein
MAGKDHRKIMTAIARELLGFIWAIGVKAEQASTGSASMAKGETRCIYLSRNASAKGM